MSLLELEPSPLLCDAKRPKSVGFWVGCKICLFAQVFGEGSGESRRVRALGSICALLGWCWLLCSLPVAGKGSWIVAYGLYFEWLERAPGMEDRAALPLVIIFF